MSFSYFKSFSKILFIPGIYQYINYMSHTMTTAIEKALEETKLSSPNEKPAILPAEFVLADLIDKICHDLPIKDLYRIALVCR